MGSKPGVGVIGCGNISGIYLKNLRESSAVELLACADLDLERAKSRAAEFGVPRAVSVADLLADPKISIVVNLTIPNAHYSVARQALEAGKHVYNEKPLAIEVAEGRQLLELARAGKLMVGGAPDTFLGAGIQTCRKLLDDGAIGEPVAAMAFMTCHGHESWHPDPEFYYKKGGGPMFDMGPYYLTALVSLLGPVKRVTGSARVSFPERVITSEPKRGTRIKVDVPTHVAGVLDFANGAVGTIVTSFDIWEAAPLPRIEIYGSEGTLRVPDPNTFGGEILLYRSSKGEWESVPHTHGHADNSRGLGVEDMAGALVEKRSHRANGEMTFHVLEIMHAFHDASREGRHISLGSSCERPQPMPVG